MIVMRHMFYGSFGMQNSMVIFIFFKFGLGKGHCQVKLSQIKSNFQFQIFGHKHTYLVHFCLRIKKNVIWFDERQLEMPKIAFQKVMSSPLSGFLTIAQPQKILLRNFTFVLFVLSFMKYIPFYLKYFGFNRHLFKIQ